MPIGTNDPFAGRLTPAELLRLMRENGIGASPRPQPRPSSAPPPEDVDDAEDVGPPAPVTIGTFEKLILPNSALEEIVAVLKQFEKRKVLLEDWGLAETIEYGLGMTFLFWGVPGTGKTHCARLIAKALGKKLKTYGAAELQSQIPGEMERQVKAMFERARRYKHVILLDECDGLVQSRQGMGQIMSSENNALLTELEQHDGVVIMTTNRVDSLDEALERRVALILEFKAPDQTQRSAIWAALLPKKMPLAPDVSMDKLSEYALTGGQIKNVILNAARFAVSKDQEAVTAADFEKAVARVFHGRAAFSSPRSTAARVSADKVRSLLEG